MRNFATSKVRNKAMCTVTLSYNEKDKANPTLYVDSVPLPEDKEYYTPEEVDKLTDEQWEDDRIYNAVMKSKEKWNI